MSTFNVGALGTSPAFSITSESLQITYIAAVTKIPLAGVSPPVIGPGGLATVAANQVNAWFPWIDEKIVAPKYDGVCQYVGMPSNRPTHVKDYHFITLMRATDFLLNPTYQGVIVAMVDTVTPSPPPQG